MRHAQCRICLPAAATFALAAGSAAAPADAQVTPAAGYSPPDDTPAIRIGATIFADYTVTDRAEDHRRRRQHVHAERVQHRPRLHQRHRQHLAHRSRSASRRTSSRETGTGSSLERQLDLPPEVRLRAVQPGRLDGARVVGALRHAADAVGRLHGDGLSLPLPGHRSSRIAKSFLSSSDVGATFRYNFASNYGDVHAGFYNGENYNRAEANDQKALHDPRHGPAAADGQPGDPRPARHRLLRSRRVRQECRADARRRRRVTYEHPYVNAGVRLSLGHRSDSRHRAPSSTPTATRSGSRRRRPKGWEGLLRFDHLEREQATTTVKGTTDRTIAGVAYWFPRQGNVSTVLLSTTSRWTTRTTPRSAPTRRGGRCTCW